MDALAEAASTLSAGTHDPSCHSERSALPSSPLELSVSPSCHPERSEAESRDPVRRASADALLADAASAIAYLNEPRWREARLGLERICELTERLGRPQDRLKFVHVAGTNGKGSTCAMLASVLQAAGYRTGLFTSPFITQFEERIRVDGAMIPPDALVEATRAVRDAAEAMDDHPTEFELMCAVALVHFARSTCDIVVLEVGLGGRFDATNVIDAPEAAVIARIGLDHTALLGNTLAAIAGEKAGIVKPGAPVVSWPQEPEAMAVVREAAAAAGSELTVPDFAQLAVEPLGGSAAAGADAEGPARAKDAPPVRRFSYRGWSDLALPLVGSYQPLNAALALETIGVLRARGWRIPDEAVRSGLAHTSWPGRFEVVAQHPTVIVDGGHNPQGARALADALAEAFPGRKATFVIGVLEDKNYPEMLEAFLPLGSGFIAVEPDNPRALPAAKLARAIRWTGQDLLGCSACTNPYVARNVQDGIARALDLAGSDGLICIVGSLYLVAPAKAALKGLLS